MNLEREKMDPNTIVDGVDKAVKFSAVQLVPSSSATNVFVEISRNPTSRKSKKPTTGAALCVTKVFFKNIVVITGLCVILW